MSFVDLRTDDRDHEECPRPGDFTAYPPPPGWKGETIGPYHPSWRDRVAQWLLGDGRPSLERQHLVQGLVGSSTGLGDRSLSLSDFTPLGTLFNANEEARAGDYKGATLAVLLSTMPSEGALERRIAAGLERGAPRTLSDLPNATPNVVEARSAPIYAPPPLPPRPFESDYPASLWSKGPPTDVQGNLRADIEGRPLAAAMVLGRRMVEAPDQALAPTQFDALAKTTSGRATERVAPQEIESRYGPDLLGLTTLEQDGEAARAKRR